MNYEIGQHVKVRTISGTISERVVYGFGQTEGVPLFCTVREYSKAQDESRAPRGIGWPAEHILPPD